MGMSTYVKGIRPPDERWQAMKAVWDACEKAGVRAPEDVQRFFEYEAPDPAGVEVKIEDTPAVREWIDQGRTAQGYEVVVANLPPEVTVIRFYNAW